VAAVLTLVQTKQIRINIYKPNSTTHSKYKYTLYQNSHTLKNCTYTNPHIKKPTHTHTLTLQNLHIHAPT